MIHPRHDTEVNLIGGTVWSNGRSRADSEQLNALRISLEVSDHRFAKSRMTPLRLGIYAFESGAKITDFGKHSLGWIKKFNLGFNTAKKHAKLFKP